MMVMPGKRSESRRQKSGLYSMAMMREGSTPRSISALVTTPVPGPSSMTGKRPLRVDMARHRLRQRRTRGRDRAGHARPLGQGFQEAEPGPTHGVVPPPEEVADAGEEPGRLGIGLGGGGLLELLEQLALAAGEVRRRLDHDLDVHVADLRVRSTGMPLPLRRNCLPVWVPSGPSPGVVPPSICGTLNSPPSAAVVIEIGTRQKMSAPSRWKNSCGLIDRKM